MDNVTNKIFRVAVEMALPSSIAGDYVPVNLELGGVAELCARETVVLDALHRRFSAIYSPLLAEDTLLKPPMERKLVGVMCDLCTLPLPDMNLTEICMRAEVLSSAMRFLISMNDDPATLVEEAMEIDFLMDICKRALIVLKSEIGRRAPPIPADGETEATAVMEMNGAHVTALLQVSTLMLRRHLTLQHLRLKRDAANNSDDMEVLAMFESRQHRIAGVLADITENWWDAAGEPSMYSV